MSNRLSCFLFAAVLLLCASFAHASNSTLTGTITDAQGNPLNGTLTMRLPVPAQDTTLLTAVSASPVTFNLVNGMIVGGAPLKDVATLQPLGLYYIARAYDYTGALQFYGNYAVTGATFNLGAATPTSVTTSNVSYILPIFPNQTNSFTATQQFITITSASSPVASSGFIRMANTDQNCWRNAANSADICVGYAAFGGLDLISVGGAGLTLSGGDLFGASNAQLTLGTFATSGNAGPSISLVAASANGTNLNGGSIFILPGARNGSGLNGTVSVQHGMGSTASSSGFQQNRTASCTTGAGAGATCNTTITWPATFDDTNYTASCTVSGGTGGVTGTPSIRNTASKTTTTMVVTIANNSAVASSGTLDCIAAHD